MTILFTHVYPTRIETVRIDNQASIIILYFISTNIKMSRKNSELGYEVEILKVKLDQMEKRFTLLERTILLLENSLRADIQTVANRNKETDNDSSSEYSTSSDEHRSISEETLNKSQSLKPSLTRRSVS
jgi:hypothetical protein